MKKTLFTLISVLAASYTFAQTQGTSAVGLGVMFNNAKNDSQTPTGAVTQQVKNQFYSIGYGYFFRDNQKLGLDLVYSRNESTSTSTTLNNTTNGYGANLHYQRYYPLIGKLYAYAGGNLGYSLAKLTYDDPNNLNEVRNENYSIGAHGGLAWFISRRWALEASLLSLNASYKQVNQTDGATPGSIYKSRQTSFNLDTDGVINNLGFKVYLMF